MTKGNDLEGIEPPKSFRNAEDSVPYSVLEENAKLKFEPCNKKRGEAIRISPKYLVFLDHHEAIHQVGLGQRAPDLQLALH